jgi:asparaginyl-tRNA synthetase
VKKNSLISGMVTDIKCLGKITFLTVSYGAETFYLVATHDQAIGYDKLKNLKNNDYITIDTYQQNEEIRVSEVVNVVQSNKGIIPESENIKAYALLLNQIRSYFSDNGFIEVRLPTIHPEKNVKEIFEIDFFGGKAGMASSNALYITAMAANIGKVYSIQRYYRAEPLETFRHLSEFDMLEVAFIGHKFECLTLMISNFVSDIFNRVKLAIPNQMKALPFEEISIISYSDLTEKYELLSGGIEKHELEIAKNGPVIVIHFPSTISTWATLPMDSKYSYSLNFLAPGVGEVAEGCLRDTREAFLRYKFAKLDLCDQLNWYVDINPLPNTKILSFGLGIERLAMWLFGITNIRSLNCFYRDKKISETMRYEK